MNAHLAAVIGGFTGAVLQDLRWRRKIRRMTPAHIARFLPGELACDCHCIDCRNGWNCPVECRKLGT